MKLLYTFLRDLKVSYRTFYVYIEIIMALIVVAVVLFVLPENFEGRSRLHLFTDPALESALTNEFIQGEAATEIILAESREDILTAMASDRSSQGVVLSEGSEGVVEFEVILQGYEDEAMRNLIEASIKGMILQEMPGFESGAQVIITSPDARRLSDRISFLPMYLLLNSAFMGLFIVAAYVFVDKEEGTIRALAVTPVSVRDYLLSKLGVMLFTGLLTGLLVTVLVARLEVNYFYLILVLIAGNLFGTVLGMFIASFYNSIISSLGAMYVVIMILAMGGVAYYMPSFSPLLVRLLPSYPLLFALRETFLERPNVEYILMITGAFLLGSLLLFIVTEYRYRKTLTI